MYPLVPVVNRRVLDWMRCRWCWRFCSYEEIHKPGCECKRSVKALNAWREAGMRGSIETGASVVLKNYFGTWGLV